MMQKKQSTKSAGFGAVEIVIAVVVVLIVSFIGWKLYDASKSKQNASTQQNSGSQSNGQQQSSDPYAGWKTYISSLAGYGIKYPSDWSVRTATSNGGGETLYITSPDRFEIRIDSGHETTDPSADVCGSACLATNTVNTFTAPKYGALKISADKMGAGGGSAYALDIFTPSGGTSIASPTKSGVTTSITGNFQGWTEAQQTQETLEQFTGSASVKTAMQIYESLTY